MFIYWYDAVICYNQFYGQSNTTNSNILTSTHHSFLFMPQKTDSLEHFTFIVHHNDNNNSTVRVSILFTSFLLGATSFKRFHLWLLKPINLHGIQESERKTSTSKFTLAPFTNNEKKKQRTTEKKINIHKWRQK